MSADQVKQIIESLSELKDDVTIPRNVREKLGNAIAALSHEDEEVSIRVDKALQEIDDVANDTNTQSYTRTQIWNIVSLLESL
jgi:uncharacterized protein